MVRFGKMVMGLRNVQLTHAGFRVEQDLFSSPARFYNYFRSASEDAEELSREPH